LQSARPPAPAENLPLRECAEDRLFMPMTFINAMTSALFEQMNAVPGALLRNACRR
jgi:hypothetical protein